MIKIEKIELNSNLTAEDLAANQAGKAELVIGNQTLAGAFKLEENSHGVMAALGFAGNVAASPAPTKVDVSNVKAKLLGKVTRKITLAAAEDEEINPGFTVTAVVAKEGGLDEGESAPTGTVSLSAVSGKIKNTGTVTVAGKVVVELTVELGEGGASSDDNVNHQIGATVGEVHVDALCRVEDTPNVKPNLTSMTVTGAQFDF